MIESAWQSDFVLVAGVAVGLVATFVAIMRDTVGRPKGSGQLPAAG